MAPSPTVRAFCVGQAKSGTASLAGLPGLSMPAGFDPDGRPVGLQLIGRHFDEARLLAVADRYQQLTDWHRRMPEEAQ